jgi:hypothetical protein
MKSTVCGAAVQLLWYWHELELLKSMSNHLLVSVQISITGPEAGAACSSQAAGALQHSVSSSCLLVHVLSLHDLHGCQSPALP